VVDEVLLVLRTLGDDPVGQGDGPVLDGEPPFRECVGPPWWIRRTLPRAWKVTTNGMPVARFTSAATSADMKKFA
jgi:hypothetical protein